MSTNEQSSTGAQDDDVDDDDDDNDDDVSKRVRAGANQNWVLYTHDFGETWNWTMLPAELQQVGSLQVDPTDDSVLYGLGPSCISRSVDLGQTWQKVGSSYCLGATGIDPKDRLTGLVIRDSKHMLLLRAGDVPLRSTSGVQGPWSPLPVPTGSHRSFLDPSREGGAKLAWLPRLYKLDFLQFNLKAFFVRFLKIYRLPEK